MPNQTSNAIKYFCDPFSIPIKLKADDQITAQCNSENNRKTWIWKHNLMNLATTAE